VGGGLIAQRSCRMRQGSRENQGEEGVEKKLTLLGLTLSFETDQPSTSADVAQLVEQLICNQQVRGSIPLVSSGCICCPQFPLHNSLPTTILPVCLFLGFPSDTRQSVLAFTI
jgi:hypothetical protein